MKHHCGKKGYFLISLVLSIFLLVPIVQATAKDAKKIESALQAEPTVAENIDSHIAGMSDVQVRKAYAQKLKQEASVQSASARASKSTRSMSEVSASFYGAARGASAVLTRVGSIFFGSETKSDAVQLSDTVAKLSDGKGALHLLLILAGVAATIAMGLLLRMLFLRSTSDLRENMLHAARLGRLHFGGQVLSRMLLDALGVGVYVLVTFIIFVVAYEEGKPSYTIASVYILVSYYLMAFAFGAGVIFSPKAPSLRLFPMEDQDASFLYQWIIRIIISAGVVGGAAEIFRALGVSKNLGLLTYSSAGAAIILALVIMIW